jgi:hypothetical protein
MADDSLLTDAARDLYGGPVSDFIAARNARVKDLKKDGHGAAATAVAAFKKPSAGADAVNRLIRADGDLADDIADLGRRLRAAQSASEAGELRALDQERRALVVRARSAARELDDSLTAATLDHVEQTVWAAVVDATAAAIVLAGALVRPLSPGGFGEVDTKDASAVAVEAEPEETAPRRRPAKRTSSRPAATPGADAAEEKRARAAAERARVEAEDAVATAQEASRAAQDAVEAATKDADEARRQRTDLEQERDELRERLAEVEQALRDSKTEITERAAALRDAERHRRSTAAAVDRAVQRLDQL